MRQRYTGVPQDDGQVLVSVVGAPVGTGVLVSSAECEKWFRE